MMVWLDHPSTNGTPRWNRNHGCHDQDKCCWKIQPSARYVREPVIWNSWCCWRWSPRQV